MFKRLDLSTVERTNHGRWNKLCSMTHHLFPAECRINVSSVHQWNGRCALVERIRYNRSGDYQASNMKSIRTVTWFSVRHWHKAHTHWSVLANAIEQTWKCVAVVVVYLSFVACLLIQNPYYPVSASVTIWYFVCYGCKHLNRDHLSECHTRAKAKWEESERAREREGEKNSVKQMMRALKLIPVKEKSQQQQQHQQQQ